MFGLQQRSGALALSSNNDNVDAARRPRLTIVIDDAQATRGPAVGAVTSRSALLWLRTGVRASVDFQLSTSPSMANPQTSQSVTATAANDFTAHVSVNGLQPDTQYYYVPRVNGTVLNLNPKPYFRTAPRRDTEQDFSFVVLTDFQSLNANTADEMPDTFRSAASANPAFYIIGGDFDHRNPGANEANLGAIRQATRRMYQENFDRALPRRADFVDYILRRGGITHLWDDHDYCCNNSDEGYVGKNVALATYDEYWPSYPRPAPDQGIYQSWRWGHVEFFLLDGRFHRTDSRATDNRNKTVLGADQKAWLKQQLCDSDAVWKVLLSGTVFNPTVKCGGDNWCEYRTEGRELVEFILDNGIENVIILSGDIHAGGITDGTNSVYNTPWEMSVPGADVVVPGCDTTTYQGPDKFGEWTHGTWGEGFRTQEPPQTCWGYGQVDVLTNPHRLVLMVKDGRGQTMIQATVTSE